MRITIAAIGKKHDPKLEAATLEYAKRLSHYTNLSWQLFEAKITPTMSAAEIKEHESRTLLEWLKPDDVVILLDERGHEMSSLKLAETLQLHMNRSVKHLVFIIGGAYGVSQELTERATFVWSLSPLVFPHQLVRLILAEQLYRAHTIIAGEKYHHS
jgi:23S rRNA (pseudouridine1915-N3)-methyltransferase